MTQATPILLKREANKNAALRPNQLVSAEANGLAVYVAKDHPYYYRQLQKAGRSVDQLGVLNAALTGDWTFEEQWAFQQGYLRFKNPAKLTLAKMSAAETAKFEALTRIWQWAREVINAGPSQCPPLALAEKAEALIREFAGDRYTLNVEYIVGEELDEQGFVGCYNVGKGSEFAPVLMSIKIYPKGQEGQNIVGALIGKGITFDSGGYVIKPRDSIGYMKCDMGGAATVAGAMALNLFEGINKPVELILCCAENLVSSTAYRPGDVITYKNGVSVEIMNTDAEGRVVLADGFLKAQESNPKVIIDAATLTGAAKIAVGSDYCALFAYNEKLRDQALADAKECHEGLWPLPFELWHQDASPSMVADTMNADNGPSAGPANASVGAGFLSRFVKLSEQKWLHYDLSNAHATSPNAMYPGGATGLMIRSIAQTFRKEI
jgi:PepB aminopeptidase